MNKIKNIKSVISLGCETLELTKYLNDFGHQYAANYTYINSLLAHLVGAIRMRHVKNTFPIFVITIINNPTR